MILPDVNLLLYARNEDAPQHADVSVWWGRCLLEPEEEIGIPWVSLLGFIRIVTSSKFTHPLTVAEALTHIASWLAHKHVRVLHPGPRHFSILSSLLKAVGTTGNHTTDAHLAAIAIEHNATLCSADNDFSRFPDLQWYNPVTPHNP